MQHLDEGLLMALLDGELKDSEQQGVEAHLRSCAECLARFDELKGFMSEADGLVVALGEPPAPSAERPSANTIRRETHRRFSLRTLAWAASIVAALGLGFAGSGLIGSGRQESNYSSSVTGQSDDTAAAIAPPPSAAPSELARQEEPPPQPLSGGTITPPVRTDELGPPEDDSTGRLARNEALAVHFSVGEFRQSGIGSLDRDLADAAARDTPAPTAQVAAKAVESALALESRAEPFAPAAPSSGAGLRRERAQVPVFQRVTMEEAVRHLSGAIRLIDGLTPEEFEVSASDSTQPMVRVLYRVGRAETRLFLEQHRADNSFVASDLQRLAPSMVVTGDGNRLSWNDLHGFTLTLSGPVRPDSLFHFKTLVK